MKILVIGGSKGTGALVVKEALERGHAVSAFSRSPERLGIQHAHLSLSPGDFHDAQAVSNAVRAQNAVIVTAMPATLKGFKENPNFFSQGTALVVDAMRAHGVKRLVVLSAFGVGDSRAHATFLLDKLLIPFLLKGPYEDHERQERLVMASGLDWVIARPTRLTSGPAHKRYLKETRSKRVPSSISRADVADFLLEAATVDTWLGHAVGLGG
jgi:putative NADH-flavin reductase